MANPPKRKVSGGGRVTPKGGPPRIHAKTAAHERPDPSSRYTPPVPREFYESPKWVPILMFTLLGIGLVLIFCNYLGLLPALWWDIPAGEDKTSNWWLLIGLGSILGGIITATQYR